MKKTATAAPKRAFDAEIMRIIAAFSVVMIHVSASNTSLDITSRYFLVPCFLNSLCRFCVPVFVMISGRFMLSKEADIKSFVKKALKTFALFLFWSALYALNDIVYNGLIIASPSELFVYILKGPFHLWYLYAAIALYLFTPFLLVFAQNATQRQMEYALLITFVFGSLVTIWLRVADASLVAIIVEKMKIDATLGFFGCYLFGYYIYNFKDAIKIKLWVGLLSTAVTFGATVFLSQKTGEANYLLFSFFAPTVLISSASFFTFAKEAFKKPLSVNMRKIIYASSSCTLGIYVIHPLLMQKLHILIYPKLLGGAVNVLASSAVIFLLSAILILIIKKIPIIRKVV